jgi:signal transduction histidine kinase
MICTSKVIGLQLAFRLKKNLITPVYYKLFNAKISFLVCFIFSAVVLSQGQDKKLVDSLQQVIDQGDDEAKTGALISMALEYFDVDNQRALNYSSEAYNKGLQYGDSAAVVKAGRISGQMLRRLDRLDESISMLEKVLPIAKRNKYIEDYKRILNALALCYTFKANYDKALEYHFESLVIRESEGNKAEISVSLNNIGLVYFKLHYYEEALDYYLRAIALKREIKDYYDLDRMLINTGLCYNQRGEFKKALSYFHEAFEICGDKCSPSIQIEGEFGLGVAFYKSKDLDESQLHFNKSFAIAKSQNDKRFQLENLVYLARIESLKKNGTKAKDYLEQAEKTASGTEYNQLLIEIYKEFAKVFNEVKNFENAALYQSKYIGLKDSIYSEKLIANITKAQVDYAERENKKLIAHQDEQIQRQRSLNFAIVIIAILATLLIFVLYRSNQVKKKVNSALSEAKQIIEDQNRQLLSSNFNLDKELKVKNADLEKANESLRRVNDELDNFIYKTSHDIRGPLASLKGMCNVALMDVHDPIALGYLRKLDITAEKLNTILTRLLIVNQINNSTLGVDRIDFNSIVSDVLLLEKKKGLPSRLKVTKDIDEGIEFYSDKEFVRIILENLIDNAIKFYNDSERIEPFVDISVVNESDSVRIKVVDNGIGISEVHPDKIFQMFSRASERSETGGIGLYITKTATEKLGGTVNLKTTPEGYTEFYVKLPFSMNKVTA